MHSGWGLQAPGRANGSISQRSSKVWQPERVLLFTETQLLRPWLLRLERQTASREELAAPRQSAGSGSLGFGGIRARSPQKSDDGDSRVEARTGWAVSEAPAISKQKAAAKAGWIPAAKPVPRKSRESRCTGT